MNKKHGPWTIKERVLKYKNPWMEVTEDKVISASGKDGIFGTVKIKPGSFVLPMDDEGNVYLIDEFRYALGKNNLAVPGGGIDGNEDPLVCAKRELKEETGITAEEWVDLGRYDPITLFLDVPQYLFLARKLKFSEQKLDETESINIVKLSFEEAVKKVMKSEITEGKTMALLFKAKQHLKL